MALATTKLCSHITETVVPQYKDPLSVLSQ